MSAELMKSKFVGRPSVCGIDYLEETDIRVDEQNGFRKGKACIDHVYALSATIRNRLEAGKKHICRFCRY